MTLPRFPLHDDPGPSFSRLVRSYGLAPDYSAVTKDAEISHATTVVACTFADGVVIAGDRRATSGNLISHRNMKKVFPADRWSGVAIAGAAGPAVEMIKMFQLQLEHYEKIEGNPLTLEGKANQLSMMVRANLQAAMMGLVVVPIFAGYDRRRQCGRVWAYDVTGGSYEETNHVASGSGSLHARTVIKLGHRPDPVAEMKRSTCSYERSSPPPTTTRPPVDQTRFGTSTRSWRPSRSRATRNSTSRRLPPASASTSDRSARHRRRRSES